MHKHQRQAIEEINGFKGPSDGALVVDLRAQHLGFYGSARCGYFTREEAQQVVADNPRIEFKPVELWAL